MQTYQVKPIGRIHVNDSGVFIKLKPDYIAALKGLDGFRHLSVIWWFSEFDTEEARAVRDTPKPYKKAPETMGIFATRSPVRPNPLALTTVEVIDIDYNTGVIRLTYTDANDGSPVLDIKPYTPSSDRVEEPGVPDWCSHWPKSIEQSGAFDWAGEFLF